MKILYYSPNPNLNLSDPAGYGTHMREMIKAFRALGHEVEVHIMGGTEPKPSVAAKPSLMKRLAKVVIPARRWQTLKDQRLEEFDNDAYDRLLLKMREFKPDFVYERANYFQTSGVNAARRLKVMHFLEVNSPYVEEKVELEGDSGMLEKAREKEGWQLTKTDHVLVVSSSLREYFLHQHRVYAAKFSVVPNAIDPEKGKVNPQDVAAVKSQYNLEGKTVVGWVGSIQPWHGVETLISSFAVVAKQRADIALLVVGSGETIATMQKLAAESGVADRIHFTGSIPHAQVFAHIAAMDIAVLPDTKWYCSPIKIFEYGLLGKAIVATHHAAVLDVMVPDQDGIIIEPGAERLQAALLKLIADPALRSQLGAHWQQKVLRSHTWEANARRVLELFEFAQTSVAR
ncbi:MAG: glycosyltransferase family 4 protein [Bacteroidetes bacterium]|nr:glycosyltransferase family 4 protein [Bacteroidota bacterium]